MMRMSNGHGRNPDFFFSAGGADPEAIYNICLILNAML